VNIDSLSSVQGNAKAGYESPEVSFGQSLMHSQNMAFFTGGRLYNNVKASTGAGTQITVDPTVPHLIFTASPAGTPVPLGQQVVNGTVALSHARGTISLSARGDTTITQSKNSTGTDVDLVISSSSSPLPPPSYFDSLPSSRERFNAMMVAADKILEDLNKKT
jgi:hypothetical protein